MTTCRKCIANLSSHNALYNIFTSCILVMRFLNNEPQLYLLKNSSTIYYLVHSIYIEILFFVMTLCLHNAFPHNHIKHEESQFKSLTHIFLQPHKGGELAPLIRSRGM